MASWGGYVFILNIIPIYVVVMVLAGRFSTRLYVAYCTFYVLGLLCGMTVPFVGFNIVRQAESAASHGVFTLLQGAAALTYLRNTSSAAALRAYARGTVLVIGAAVVVTACVLLWAQASSRCNIMFATVGADD